MDALSDILDLLELRGTMYFRTAFSPPYAVAVPPQGRAARFHLVAQGRCHVRIEDGPSITLNTGDMILVPNGAAHVLSDEPDRPPTALDDVLRQSGYTGEGVLAFGGDPRPDGDTKLICGHLNFADGVEHPLLRALPSHLLVTAELRARSPWLDELMRLIIRQMFAGSPGFTASVIRLSEALFIEAVRACADQDEALRRVVTAIGDARIGRALSLMHRELDGDWTLDRIAREVGMSRSRFAEQFQALMGSAPMSYLSDQRLQKAMALLSATGEPIQRVAAQVGYQSAAAFSRAFSNRYGHSPSDVRRAAA